MRVGVSACCTANARYASLPSTGEVISTDILSPKGRVWCGKAPVGSAAGASGLHGRGWDRCVPDRHAPCWREAVESSGEAVNGLGAGDVDLEPASSYCPLHAMGPGWAGRLRCSTRGVCCARRLFRRDRMAEKNGGRRSVEAERARRCWLL